MSPLDTAARNDLEQELLHGAYSGNGSVRFVNDSISRATLTALFTRNGEDKPGDF